MKKPLTIRQLKSLKYGQKLVCINGFKDGRKLHTGAIYKFLDYIQRDFEDDEYYINVIPDKKNGMYGYENWSYYRFALTSEVKRIEII